MSLYTKFIRPVFFLQDPEKIHNRFVFMGKLMGSNPLTRGLLMLMYDYTHPMLEQNIEGMTFKNPIGLAAGFDKDCQLMKALPAMNFGFEEVGSITAQPYEGNPKPRLKRLPDDESIIVYYGLKNRGAKFLRNRLDTKFQFPVGVSVAKTNKKFNTDKDKLDDWALGIRLMKDYGNYLTINLSCPNTHDTANYCDPKLLEKLLKRIEKDKLTFSKPVFLKLSIHTSRDRADEIIKLCQPRAWIKGFVIGNLVKDRSTVELKSPKEMYEPYKGGLSGKVCKEKALDLVRYVHRKAGDRFVLIGCGGIFTAEDAYEYIQAGASLLQLITGMIYEGPGAMKKINKGLVRLLQSDGHKNISEAVGER